MIDKLKCLRCPECGAKLDVTKDYQFLYCPSCAVRIGYKNSRYDAALKNITAKDDLAGMYKQRNAINNEIAKLEMELGIDKD